MSYFYNDRKFQGWSIYEECGADRNLPNRQNKSIPDWRTSTEKVIVLCNSISILRENTSGLGFTASRVNFIEKASGGRSCWRHWRALSIKTPYSEWHILERLLYKQLCGKGKDCEDAAHQSSGRGNEAFNQSAGSKNGREISQNDNTDCWKFLTEIIPNSHGH